MANCERICTTCKTAKTSHPGLAYCKACRATRRRNLKIAKGLTVCDYQRTSTERRRRVELYSLRASARLPLFEE